ncbi:type I-E CRISPR-associated protein Cas6/Cse3/CasE [Limnochorda pilosa]|uniref:CRISPR-associated protein Cse3 n=1 Tax=Limnochorda pilosa TaxID=1555112 RepID=A0A0K2SJM3_LIMPI|nr:type I-E CRISPR-associated protein Cas6/Cse3/CasE [Limnochorda pilosa]BAS27313.1 CRISPR-associated protein Cse3 [Limnochorda pilosa]
MYLSRLILNPRNRAVRRDLADVQGLHRTLMRGFPAIEAHAEARQRFGMLYRLESPPLAPRLQLLVQSTTAPDWSGLERDYLARMGGNPSVKQVSELYASIQTGQVLRFRLRANPTKKIDTKSAADGSKRNGRRVVLRGDEALQEWLHRKADEAGFRLLTVRFDPGVADVRTLDAGRQVARITGHHGRGVLTIDAVMYEGRLQVTNRERFLEALVRGIGPAKAYGCGLLSVAPAAVHVDVDVRRTG